MTARPASVPFVLRRTADFTALRLGRAVLAYLAVMMGIITLAPFRFSLTPAHGLTQIWNWSDLIMNVLMFVPFGFVYQLTRPRGAPPDWPRVLILGAALSGTIELLQLFLPTRYTSLLDLASNTVGAALGAWVFARLADRVQEEDAVQSLALELPLMGLVYLLVPLCWLIGLASSGETRRALVLPIAMIAGAILGTVHTAYIVPLREGRRYDLRWLLGTVGGWTLVSLVPGARGDMPLIAAGLVLALATAVLRGEATARAFASDQARRFEIPTLRFILPLFAAYLALSAVWPLTGASPSWRWALALTVPGIELSTRLVYQALEQVAAFTLVGYISAEYYGRDTRVLLHTLPRLVLWTFTASLLLQIARGFHEDHSASVTLFLLCQVAAAFGHWLYALQRAHIQALVQRRTRLSAFRKAAGISDDETVAAAEV